MPYSKERKKLKRLLGKTLRYYGRYIIIDEEKKIYLLKNIKYNKKLVTDHVWFRASENQKNLPKESQIEISFYATAEAYEDSNGNKKYGLDQIHNLIPVTKTIQREHRRFWQRKNFKGNK